MPVFNAVCVCVCVPTSCALFIHSALAATVTQDRMDTANQQTLERHPLNQQGYWS